MLVMQSTLPSGTMREAAAPPTSPGVSWVDQNSSMAAAGASPSVGKTAWPGSRKQPPATVDRSLRGRSAAIIASRTPIPPIRATVLFIQRGSTCTSVEVASTPEAHRGAQGGAETACTRGMRQPKGLQRPSIGLPLRPAGRLLAAAATSAAGPTPILRGGSYTAAARFDSPARPHQPHSRQPGKSGAASPPNSASGGAR